ncbi:HEAT repeat domain-containing protein [Oscillatoria sp. CS-180]|uniref:HEAT repeat domain-containing protein n=1 Tax=Oscillatoria sp. CS-180 TaxID=3021720 RepID=UPI00232FAD1A|nr:HEAT repeat domain-containing protein [Oscillatoria sp. CS-180]MDB9525572.1 HEAT repeat domain-containing protein [Oscillatoria sp. CS-180]
MYDEDDLKIVDPDIEFDDPLDHIAPPGEAGEEPQYDPEEMLSLLNSSSAQQRMMAARAFCELEEPRAVSRLVELLKDSCPLVRVSAAYALGRNCTQEAIAPLIQQLSDWNGYVRKGIVWALGNSHTPEALEPLIDALRTDIPAVRLWAASALAQMTKVNYETVVAALPPIIEVMRRDPIAAVRSNCAWAIGELCRELPSNVVYATAIDALIETFAEDDDLGVREDARTAILNVGDPRGLQIIEELEQDGWF